MKRKQQNQTKPKAEQSLMRMGMRRFARNRLAMFGLIVLLTLTIASIVAPLIVPYARDKQNLLQSHQAPSAEHLLGTDKLGRDVFTRLMYGGRVSLSVGLISTAITVAIGVFLGALAGFYGGKVDMFIMRIADIFMCFPFFVIAITLAAILGPSIWNVMLITGLLSWTTICRIVRGEVLSLREREFIEAGRSIGLSDLENIFRHILPNILSVVIVYATLGIAGGILSEAGLSYLGLGVKQPQPSWGNMLAEAQNIRNLTNRLWLWVPPGVLVFLTILSINFVGDGLRDALDPKLNREGIK